MRNSVFDGYAGSTGTNRDHQKTPFKPGNNSRILFPGTSYFHLADTYSVYSHGVVMSAYSHHTIQFSTPVFHEIREKGYVPVDMHIHTRHSDAAISIPSLLTRAKHLGTGVAITDHNEIQGVIEAYKRSPDVLVIPGIELSALEGPHILLYFYTVDELVDYFTTHIRGTLRKSQYMALQLSAEKILESAEDYHCLKVAAHPFGYFGINRGILKCIDNKTLPAGTIDHIDGIEVICGGMSREINDKAAMYAGKHNFPVTGGSDAHVLPSVGSVVTCARAGTVAEFLNGILSRENLVIGSTVSPLHKGMTAGVIAWNYIPYTMSSLQVHYEQNIPRMKRYLRDLLK
jgi:predicted metal-dependent phosphoesterase TrpH